MAHGFRVTIWLTGCHFHCFGCFNEHLWSFNVGKPVTQEVYDKIRRELMNPKHAGLTILGGEPMCDENKDTTRELIRIARECGKDVWVYTGYYMEELTPEQRDIIDDADVVIDGRFELACKDISLKWKGSSNQRLWAKPHGLWQVVG